MYEQSQCTTEFAPSLPLTPPPQPSKTPAKKRSIAGNGGKKAPHSSSVYLLYEVKFRYRCFRFPYRPTSKKFNLSKDGLISLSQAAFLFMLHYKWNFPAWLSTSELSASNTGSNPIWSVRRVMAEVVLPALLTLHFLPSFYGLKLQDWWILAFKLWKICRNLTTPYLSLLSCFLSQFSKAECTRKKRFIFPRSNARTLFG